MVVGAKSHVFVFYDAGKKCSGKVAYLPICSNLIFSMTGFCYAYLRSILSLVFGWKVEVGWCYLFTQDRAIESDPNAVDSLLYALVHNLCINLKTALDADTAYYRENILS